MISTTIHAKHKTKIVTKFSKKAIGPIKLPTSSRIGAAASYPVAAINPGLKRFVIVKPVPVAFRPRPAKLWKIMLARNWKLPMMYANAQHKVPS